MSRSLCAQRSGISIRLGMDMILREIPGPVKPNWQEYCKTIVFQWYYQEACMKVVDAVDYEESLPKRKRIPPI